MAATDEPTETADDRAAARGAHGAPHVELTQITRALVGIYKDQLGRGPEHAHSHYAGADMIISVLEGTLTPGEQKLVALGHIEQMQSLRQLFQATTRPAFTAAVEEITGRRVVSFMSGNDIENDVSSEVFVLERPTQSP
jgi:uncharacterized protein YbcI